MKIKSYTYIYSRHTGKKRKNDHREKGKKRTKNLSYHLSSHTTLLALKLSHHLPCCPHVSSSRPVRSSQSVSLASCAPLAFLLFDATYSYSYSFVRFSYFFDPAHAAPITEKKKTTPLKPHRTYKPPHTPHTQTQTPAPGLAFNPAPCPR